MGLIGNYRALYRVTTMHMSGLGGGSRGAFLKPGMVLGRFGHLPSRAARPTGYEPPAAYQPPRTGGELVGRVVTDHDVDVNVALGKSVEVDITSSSTVAAALGLITSLSAAIASDSSVAASIASTVSLAASIASSSSIEADAGLLVNVVAAITSSNAVTASMFGTLDMSASIQSYSELSPESLAQSVWSALAAQNNSAGTMGEKLNDAGSAGDPWSTNVPGAYAEGTAGALMGRLLTMPMFLALKDQ